MKAPAEPAPAAAGKVEPYIPAGVEVPEFTIKAVIFGSLFGIIFGASTVYLALKAGLTVSDSRRAERNSIGERFPTSRLPARRTSTRTSRYTTTTRAAIAIRCTAVAPP